MSSNENNKKDVNKKEKSFIKKLAVVIGAACIFGLIAGLVFQGYVSNFYKDNPKKIEDSSKDTVNQDGNSEDLALETNTSPKDTSDVSTIVENVMPSIVAINISANNTVEDFFGRQYNQQSSGSGSGIIIGQNDTELLIATNNHVINGASSIGVVFIDDTTANAAVKGTAPNSDLAVLSVDIESLSSETMDAIKIATLGSSDSIKLGEMAIAIGNALGYGQSVTVGYISAVDREVTIDNITLKVLQTDAAINPGNSGGALLNSKGEVIGINSIKYVSESVESVGYAIPISDAVPIINNLMNRTTLADSEKAYLGIDGKDVTDIYSQRFNLPVGIYVSEIKENSAAEKAGIKAGDIIVSINDMSVSSKTDLQEALNYTRAESTGTITVKTLVNGQYEEKVLDITFGKRP